MKTEVYSWRVSTGLKTELEREARRRKVSLAAVLDLAAQEWLKKSSAGVDDDAEQQRLRQAALQCVGSIAGGNPSRAENARSLVQARLRQRYGR
jgi:hypothetical protein